jgi:anion-transporting  ArsA/GET3 family ATPase
MSNFKNFYIFTGKGGVGKTTLSLAFAKHLIDCGQDVTYINIENTSLKKTTESTLIAESKLASALGVPFKKYELEQCAREYITKKLKSETAAKWIVKTPFFRALINMIPGFNYLIFMGRILETIEESQRKKIIVLDSPSSGHAMTMLESAKNFNELFSSGVIYEDTKKMLTVLEDPSIVKVNVIALPTLMALNEGKELKRDILKILPLDTQIIINNSFYHIEDLDEDHMPEFIVKKISNEKEVIAQADAEETFFVPHVLSADTQEIASKLAQNLEGIK